MNAKEPKRQNKTLLSKQGADHIDNLQIICDAYDSKRGMPPQEEFIDALVLEDFRQPSYPHSQYETMPLSTS